MTRRDAVLSPPRTAHSLSTTNTSTHPHIIDMDASASDRQNGISSGSTMRRDTVPSPPRTALSSPPPIHQPHTHIKMNAAEKDHSPITPRTTRSDSAKGISTSSKLQAQYPLGRKSAKVGQRKVSQEEISLGAMVHSMFCCIFFSNDRSAGPMARRLTTNQEIAGSIPASIKILLPDLGRSIFAFCLVCG
jgi:hypothetical protein